MKYLVISCSLNPDSRSRLLAGAVHDHLDGAGEEVELLDLQETGMPLCDGDGVYAEPAVGELGERVRGADGILMAVPIYNYDVNAAAKNLIELTGRAWTDKVVAFACAAGGQGSYMSVMGVANSLMLDFRCHVVPRFVYATGDAFQGDEVVGEDVRERLAQVADELRRVTGSLRGGAATG